MNHRALATLWLAALLGCSGAQFDLNAEEPTNGSTEAGHDDSSPLGSDSGGAQSDSGNVGESSDDGHGGVDSTDSNSETSAPFDSIPPVDSCAFDASDHHNGYDGAYTHCGPRGGADASTYTLAMANAARASVKLAGSDSSGTCGTTATPGGAYVRRQGVSSCVTWVYAGAAFGGVAYSAICSCPEAIGPRWY